LGINIGHQSPIAVAVRFLPDGVPKSALSSDLVDNAWMEVIAEELIDPAGGAGVNTHLVAANLLDEADGSPVVDIGAGKGNFTHVLELHGYRAIAIDIDPDDYSYARAPFVQANLGDGLPLSSASCGGIVAIEIIEHLEEPLLLIREIARCLRPDGFAIITTPNVLSIASKLELVLRGRHEDFDDYSYRVNGHICPVSLQQIVRMCERTGLTLEAETYNVGRLPLPKIRRQLNLTSTRFRTRRFGQSLIVKLRKTGSPVSTFSRG